METINDILNILRQYTGNAQIECLMRYKDNNFLKEILEYTYDTHKKYKIDEGKFNKFFVKKIGTKVLDEQNWQVFKKHILEPYSQLKSAKDEHVANLIYWLNMFDEPSQEILKMIIFKDLRLGMNAKKFQKVWPDFLITYPYMGCRTFSMKNLQSVEYPAFAQTKMDGTFCNIIVDLHSKQVQYISRQSKPHPIQGSLDNEILSKVFPFESLNLHNFKDIQKFVLTGEILVWDSNMNKPLPRKLSNGIIRRDNKTVDELNRIHFVCWDMLPYNAFVAKKFDLPYEIRWTILTSLLQDKSSRIHLVNCWKVNNEEEALKKFNEQYALGEEGIVVKSLKQIWQDGKPAGQVKIKAEKDCDLFCYDMEEGTGMFQGMLGALKCKSRDDLLYVNVGTGFTQENRQEIWQNKDKYLNNIITIKYNEKIQDSNSQKWSLYLPVFVELRTDKQEADNLNQII